MFTLNGERSKDNNNLNLYILTQTWHFSKYINFIARITPQVPSVAKMIDIFCLPSQCLLEVSISIKRVERQKTKTNQRFRNSVSWRNE